MQALANHLSHKSTRLVQNILFTIRNLSDAATKQVKPHSLSQSRHGVSMQWNGVSDDGLWFTICVSLQDHLDDLLRQLIMLLSSNDVTIVTCSAGVLSNLTCNNAKNKTIVCQLQGVTVCYMVSHFLKVIVIKLDLSQQALLKAINNSDGREEIIEASVCALRHITSRHPSAETAQNAVRQQSGIPMLTNFLQQQCRWPLMKALLGEDIGREI